MKATFDGVKVKVTRLVEGQDWPRGVSAGGSVMVKVYQRTRADGKLSYEVADYSKGHRVLRACKSEDLAIQTATRIAKALASGDVEAASMRNAEAASYGRAIELLRPTGVCLEVACAHFADAFKILGADKIVAAAEFYRDHNADKITPKTVSEVVTELLAAKANKARKTVKDLKSRCERFAEDFKNVDIGTISTPDVSRWLDSLKDVEERTRFNYRTKIGQLFTFAERRGYIMRHSNPVEGTETPDVPEGEIQTYTPTEIERLLAAATDPDFRVCIALGAFAGLRSSEIQRLDWKDISFQRGHIKATGRKRNTPATRFVPLTDNLRKWLEQRAKKSGLVWLPDEADRQVAENIFSNAQEATSEATGDAEKKIKPVPWKHNALRHSFISYRLAEVQNVNQVALECGNSAKMIFKHYRELATAEDAAKWFAVAPKEKAEGEKIIQLAAATN